MFSLASKLLYTVASPAFEKAYQKGLSIWEAKDDLKKLQETIEIIKARLLDAEKKQDTSVAVKNLMKRVRAVLYDAEDLFDEVATDNMLKQQISKEGKILKKVQASCSKLNPIVSRNSIANQVKDIRKRLLDISTDMAQFEFVKCDYEEPITGARKAQDPGSFVDSKSVVGREGDKKSILEMLLHDQSNDDVLVIAIVGIGGMGKTTLTQLVYNHEEVQKYFEKRWFACISDISDDGEVIGKIFQSVCDQQNYGGFNLGQLQAKIRESIRGKKFLLVLDDVWDDDRSRWMHRMGLLSGCAKGSKIIVTTRSLAVSMAVGAVGSTHTLDGLSVDDSWALFKRIAFTPEQENDPRWMDLGRQIVKKCANVPLAIKSIGSLLYTKTTIQEWGSIIKEQLTKVEESDQVPVISVLMLSYDHLHSNLKQCFAYCSLFPKDYVFRKWDLIYLWIAQGYIKPNSEEQTFEEVGHSYFMGLFRMSFFQEARYDDCGEIKWCKMHDLIHDLAQQVAAEDILAITSSKTEIKGTPQHANVGCIAGDSTASLTPLWNCYRLRSLFFINVGSTNGLVLDQEFAKLKFLRALKLSGLGIENVPSSIGELKLLRYLDVSKNKFKRLPDSVTKLPNLCALDLNWCHDLEALPNELRKLVNLRHLKIGGCGNLRYVPPGFGEFTSLQHLDWFIVGGGMGRDQCSKLDDLFTLKLRGELKVYFGDDSYDDDWDGVECWQPFVNLQGLEIMEYRGVRIPHWANGKSADSPSLLLPNLTRLSLIGCSRVKCLPPFRHLPNLEILMLHKMSQLEYIEDEEEENGGKQNLTASSDALFFPSLKELELWNLLKLKGWWRKSFRNGSTGKDVVSKGPRFEPRMAALYPPNSTSASASAQLPSFPSLSTLEIKYCQNLKYMPLCLRLRVLSLDCVDANLIEQLLSMRDHSSLSTTTSSSSTLERVKIVGCNEHPTHQPLRSFLGKSLTSLRHLCIEFCEELKRVELPPAQLNILEGLHIQKCFRLKLWEKEKMGVDWDSLPDLHRLERAEIPFHEERHPDWLRNLQEGYQLKLWEKEKVGVDWDSLQNLRRLELYGMPSPEKLPDCLQNLQSLGKLQIIERDPSSFSPLVETRIRRIMEIRRRRME